MILVKCHGTLMKIMQLIVMMMYIMIEIYSILIVMIVITIVFHFMASKDGSLLPGMQKIRHISLLDSPEAIQYLLGHYNVHWLLRANSKALCKVVGFPGTNCGDGTYTIRPKSCLPTHCKSRWGTPCEHLYETSHFPQSQLPPDLASLH